MILKELKWDKIYCYFSFSHHCANIQPEVTLIRDQVWINVDAYDPKSRLGYNSDPIYMSKKSVVSRLFSANQSFWKVFKLSFVRLSCDRITDKLAINWQ